MDKFVLFLTVMLSMVMAEEEVQEGEEVISEQGEEVKEALISSRDFRVRIDKRYDWKINL